MEEERDSRRLFKKRKRWSTSESTRGARWKYIGRFTKERTFDTDVPFATFIPPSQGACRMVQNFNVDVLERLFLVGLVASMIGYLTFVLNGTVPYL